MIRKTLFGSMAVLSIQALAAELPGEGPRLGHDRITQVEIESGELTLHDIRLAGLRIFTTQPEPVSLNILKCFTIVSGAIPIMGK